MMKKFVSFLPPPLIDFMKCFPAEDNGEKESFIRFMGKDQLFNYLMKNHFPYEIKKKINKDNDFLYSLSPYLIRNYYCYIFWYYHKFGVYPVGYSAFNNDFEALLKLEDWTSKYCLEDNKAFLSSLYCLSVDDYFFSMIDDIKEIFYQIKERSEYIDYLFLTIYFYAKKKELNLFDIDEVFLKKEIKKEFYEMILGYSFFTNSTYLFDENI